MKPAILRRLEELEAAANRRALPPLQVIDVTKFEPEDREAYWQGDDAILKRYGGRDDVEGVPEGVHTVIIDIHEDMRSRWIETRDMDESELEILDDPPVKTGSTGPR